MTNYTKKRKHITQAFIAIALIAVLVLCVVWYGEPYPSHHREKIRTSRVNNIGLKNILVNEKTLPISARPQTTRGKKVHAKSFLVMNSNGKISYGKNINTQRKVASCGKLMALYLIQRKANSYHEWNAKVMIPKNIASMSNDAKDGVGSEFKLKANHQYTVSDLYRSALIESSNSATIALGEWVAGSNARFVNLMNEQAHAWHLGAHFISTSGLENDSIQKFGLKVSGSKKAGNTMSAKDLAIVTQHLLKEFPQITKWSSRVSDKIGKTTISNSNSNLSGIYYVKGCDGLKTGFTPSAGYCYIGTKKQDHGHKIIVLLNDPQDFQDGKTLLQ